MPPKKDKAEKAGAPAEEKAEKADKPKKDKKKSEAPAPSDSDTEPAEEGKEKKDKKDKKSKKEAEPKSIPGDAATTETAADSVNPPADTAVPGDPVIEKKKSIRQSVAPMALAAAAPKTPELVGMGQGSPPMDGKPGWRRVSTRQWLRDFRTHIGQLQGFPYKPVCGMLFFSFGYYPDIVPQDSYQRYTAHHPIAIKRHSTDDGEVPPGAALVPQATDTSVAPSSTTIDSSVSQTTDSNTDIPPVLPPTSDKKEDGAPEPEGDGKKKKKDKSKSIAGDSEAPPEDGSKKDKKEKKGKKDKGDDGGTPAEEGGGEKKAKKGKGKEAAAEGGDTSGAEGEGKAQGKEKKKKGKGA